MARPSTGRAARPRLRQRTGVAAARATPAAGTAGSSATSVRCRREGDPRVGGLERAHRVPLRPPPPPNPPAAVLLIPSPEFSAILGDLITPLLSLEASA